MNLYPKPRLRASDVVALAFYGIRAYPLRATLSALGIAIGIAAMIAVIGISTSSEAKVQERLASLGTNQLTVSAGKSAIGQATSLPADAADRLRRLEGVEAVGWVATLKGLHVYRNALIDEGNTSGLTVAATDSALVAATRAELATGRWLNAATELYPATVLGTKAAERLGAHSPGSQVWIAGQNFTVVGILQHAPLAPELDTMVLVGEDVARERLGFDGSPTTIFERSTDATVTAVRELIPATVNPKAPNEVSVSRPSDALAAQHAIDQAFTGMLVGVGSIALLVGGVGVANTMVITVLERRREIGLRRSLGATRAHIRTQFLVEAVMLASYGGAVGTLLGMAITFIVAHLNEWAFTIPPIVIAGGIAVTIAVGAVAGMLPAIRAAGTSPTASLAS